MAITEAQARRAAGYADLPFDDRVVDPRHRRGSVHPHQGLLGVLALAFAAGKRTLRRVEDFSQDLGRGARRALGLVRVKVSDTALFQVLARQGRAGLRETVYAQVKGWLSRKLISHDLFRLGVMSFDGKGTWSSTAKAVEGTKASSCDPSGSPLNHFGALRAVLTSSSARPCLDQEFIGAKESEPNAFRTMFPRLAEHFGRTFRIVTADAGLCARELAQLVVDAGKWYLFGLKENQPNLYQLAHRYFFHHHERNELRARTEERYRGKTIVRELFTWSVVGHSQNDMPGLVELWYVAQTTRNDQGAFALEQRYFVSAIPAGEISDDEKLSLVRLHWGIENGAHWTMDMVLGEDDSQPCQTSREAMEVVAWLRVLGYNIVSLYRAKGPQQDGRPLPWERVTEKLRDVLLQGRDVLAPAS